MTKRFACIITLFLITSLSASETPPQLDAAWLQAHLKADGPRLIWQEGDEARIRERITSDPVAREYHAMLLAQAEGLLETAPAERILEGRRLLGVSREVLTRTTVLSYAWRISSDARYLDRLDAELQAVCNFRDWNPSHFLDVAEMSLAVAIAIDWCGEALPDEVVALAKRALKEKAMDEGEVEKPEPMWALAPHNWNQVCNAGMVAAALVTAEDYPEQALRMLNRMRHSLPRVLETYAPDGVYVEGATYWGYGTGFNVILFSMLETALGTDFGLSAYPGFMESADFVGLVRAPSGDYYNYFDCGSSSGYSAALAWFAMKTGESRHLQSDRMLQAAQRGLEKAGAVSRIGAFAFLWYNHFVPGESKPLPLVWHGRSENPLIIFRSSFEDPNALYLAAKGGKATLNHGNMDAGSFIFELNGVRWSIDPGNQSYHPLEVLFAEIGGTLWSSYQDSRRWTLLTKNNFGHSTVSIDGMLHNNDGPATVIRFDEAERFAELNMTYPLMTGARKATRSFRMLSDTSIEIIDTIKLQPYANFATWQMITQADVSLVPGGAILEQEGQRLRLTVNSPQETGFSVISLDPPPLAYDKRIEGLKRLELTVPAYLDPGNEIRIEVLLEGM